MSRAFSLRRAVYTALIILFTSALAWPAPSNAQAVNPSAGQEQLNDQAVEAAIAGNFDKAVRLFRASLDLGELNVTYLNLGRALFKLGKCTEADEAYGKALVAPQVQSPTVAEVQEFVATYRSEFEDKCPGTVRLSCTPDTLKVSVDGGLERACRGSVQLPPGLHTVSATHEGQHLEQQVTVTAMSAVSVSLEAPDAVEEDGGIPVRTWAWVSTGVGASLVLIGLVVDAAIIGPDFDDYEAAAAKNDTKSYNDLKSSLESEQTINLVVLITGGAVLATAGALFLYDSGLFGADESASAVNGGHFGLWADAHSSGLTWGLRF
jgi:tetratricopeptide (TPR) repeat protein